MYWLIRILILISSFQVLAEEKPVGSIWTSGPPEAAKNIFPKSKIRVLSAEDKNERFKRSGHMPPWEQEALFRKLGIESKVSKMDPYAKDMLVISARVYTLRELKTEYPHFTENELTRLKKEVGKGKRK